MQFGKFHGIAFLIFGFLLLVLQAWLIFSPGPVLPPNAAPQTPPVHVTQKVNYLPAMVGIASLITGSAIYLSNRQKGPAATATYTRNRISHS